MSSTTNGGNGRMYDLNAARLWARGRRPADVNPDSAHALIDRVFMSYGLDPMRLTDRYGWRHLALGSAEGVVGVVEWQPGEFFLVVLAPILSPLRPRSSREPLQSPARAEPRRHPGRPLLYPRRRRLRRPHPSRSRSG